MANHLVFSDEQSELKCYVNHEHLLYIEITDNETPEYFGCITLNSNDIEALIDILKNSLDEVDIGGLK